jgi:hypothetical protein
MFGAIFCRLWAHKRKFMFTNGVGKAVLHCERCSWVKADTSK